MISVFLKQALHNEPITVHGDGSQARDFIHVRDIYEAYLAATVADCHSEAFNVGTGTSVLIVDLAETIRDVTDSDATLETCGAADASPRSIDR